MFLQEIWISEHLNLRVKIHSGCYPYSNPVWPLEVSQPPLSLYLYRSKFYVFDLL